MATKKVTKKTTKKTTKPVAKKVVRTAAKKRTPTTKKVTKKVTKKTAKKAPTKRTKKTTAERVMICAPSEHCFWTSDGQVLKDLVELRDALKAMELDVYGHHVTTDRNDFADWVEHVLQDAACAASLRKARKPQTARSAVVRHIKLYIL